MKKKMFLKKWITIALLIFVLSLCGCGRSYYWEYSGKWCCDDPYIQLSTYDKEGVIEIDGEQIPVSVNNEDSKREIIFSRLNYKNGEEAEQRIWDTTAKVKGHNLYLKINKDYVGNMQGKELILQLEEEK